MKSTHTFMFITLGSALLSFSIVFSLCAWLPNVLGTVQEVMHAISYACTLAWTDFTNAQIIIADFACLLIFTLVVWILKVAFSMTRSQTLNFGHNLVVTRSVQHIAAAAGLCPAQLNVVVDNRAFAMTTGLWRPRVTISSAALNILTQSELRAVLEHEAHHVAMREPFRRMILALALLWIPVRVLREKLHTVYVTESEVEADEHVADQRTLGLALVRLVYPPTPSVGFSPLDARVERLVNPQYKRTSRLALMFGIAGLAIAVACTSFTPLMVRAAYSQHSVPTVEAHLTMCKAEHEHLLQSQQHACGPLSTPRSCQVGN